MSLVLTLAAAGPPAGFAQPTNRPAPRPAPADPGRGHRFLLIVETSKPMEKRTEGIALSILDVLGSGVKGKVNRGDSLALWMFNDTLITGKYPTQPWGPDNQNAAATAIVEFLQKQKFEKQPLTDKLIPTLKQVVASSRLITVILLTSGSAEVQGTGFDDRINSTYKEWRARQQKSKMPFVVLLRGRNGVLTDCGVAPAPWAAELPPVPPEPVAQATPKSKQNPVSQPSTLPPLIVRGKRPEPALPTSNSTNQAPVTAAAMALSTTNAPATNSQPSLSLAAVPADDSAVSNRASGVVSAAQAGTTNSAGSPLTLAATGPAGSVLQPAPGNSGPGDSSLSSGPAVESRSLATPPSGSAKGRPFPTHLVLLALLGAGLAVFFAIWIPRLVKARARHAEHVSLITRSLDRSAH